MGIVAYAVLWVVQDFFIINRNITNPPGYPLMKGPQSRPYSNIVMGRMLRAIVYA